MEVNREKFPTICSCHKTIKNITHQGKLKVICEDSVKDIYKIADLAHDMGCSMEARLKLYKKNVLTMNKTYRTLNSSQSPEEQLDKLKKAIIKLNRNLGFNPDFD